MRLNDSIEAASALLEEHFGPGPLPRAVRVPGRVNLIGEHIDYHSLPVLPIAIERGLSVAFRPRTEATIRAVSLGFEPREFEWTTRIDPSPPGDWANYVKAAAQAVGSRWGVLRGIDAAVVSNLPAAAGLSSSSALLTAFTLALLRSNGIEASFEELMDVLPEGEYFVGTRGGGMDHAAVLAARAGHALLVHFAPLAVEHVPVPPDWAFLVAHSLTGAEKSGALREEYNARRMAGTRALARSGASAYSAADPGAPTAGWPEDERRAYLHVTGEAARVRAAVHALRAADAPAFGRLLYESHDSLRDLLRVSSPALDELVATARRCGALGARLTGAGFGGCAVLFSMRSDLSRLKQEVCRQYYSGKAGFDPDTHLIEALPSSGALHV